MEQLVKGTLNNGSKNSDGNSGKFNIVIVIIIILLLCSCGNAEDIFGGQQRRRTRRRLRRRGNSRTDLILLGLVFAALSGNTNGRNENTNIINIETPNGESENLGLLDL